MSARGRHAAPPARLRQSQQRAQPAPAQPAPAQPAPRQPAPAQQASAQPAPRLPAPAQQGSAEPAPAQPARGKPGGDEPPAAGELSALGRSAQAGGWRRASPSTVAGFLIIAAMIVFCFAAPLLYRPNLAHVNLALANQPPSMHHPLGTDQYGIDVLGRLMTGGQLSLEVGVAAGLLAVVIGALWGAVAGYLGGIVDAIMMRVVDAVIAIPVIVLLLLLTASYTPSPGLLVLVIAATSWLGTARLVRGTALSLRSREFVQAVRAMGGGRTRVILRHIAPNALGTITVSISFQIADAVVVLATLSYLGLGVQPPAADWGDMIAAGVQSIYSGHWWQIYPAGAAIMLVVVGFNLLGDGLRDMVDPRRRT